MKTITSDSSDFEGVTNIHNSSWDVLFFLPSYFGRKGDWKDAGHFSVFSSSNSFPSRGQKLTRF